MSNIYIQEPPTSGKVLLKTSVGDIDIELWCREAPKTCRNFIQLCMEGYYNNTIFHRLVKGFIVQGGDPSGDGTGGESVYGGTFKDEFHSRLRFIRRGLVAMANAGRDDNASQFFFTLGEASELQNKHTLFGKVTGDTVYNMLKLEDGEVDQNERPMYPHRILKTEVLLNPFEDIVPRELERKRTKEKKQKREKGVKNFGLLSFGNEAEEDEEETNEFVQKNSGKAKSTHDLLVDPKLSKETATFVKVEKDSEDEANVPSDKDEDDEEAEKTAALKESIRNKLKSSGRKSAAISSKQATMEKTIKTPVEVVAVSDSDSDSDGLNNELERERRAKKKVKAAEIREQITSLKRDYQKDKRDKDAEAAAKQAKSSAPAAPDATDNEVLQSYLSEQQKYSHLKSDMPKKGAQREQQTLALLQRFKSKLEQVKQTADSDEEEVPAGVKKPPVATGAVREITSDNEDDIADDSWMGHTLRFEEKAPVLAKDASTKHDDWYDAFDPRNPLNKRKRGDEAKSGSGSGGRERGSGGGEKRPGGSRR